MTTQESIQTICLALPSGNPPAAPTNLTASPGTTSLDLAWTQPPGEPVDSYLITYNYTVRGCDATGGGSSNVTSGDNETLISAEENADYTISISARNGAGESESVIVMTTTLMAGKRMSWHNGLIIRFQNLLRSTFFPLFACVHLSLDIFEA